MYENNSAMAQTVGSAQLQSEASGLTAVGQRMAEAIKSLDILVSQIAEAETRLNGSRPTDKNGGAGTPRPVPNGTIGLLMAGMDEISVRIAHAQQLAAMLARNI